MLPLPPLSEDLRALIGLARSAEGVLMPAIRPDGAADPLILGFARLVDAFDETAAAGPHLPPEEPDPNGLAAAETEYALGLLALLLEAVTLTDQARAAGAITVPDRERLLTLGEAVMAVVGRCRARVTDPDLLSDYSSSETHLSRRVQRLAQTGPAPTTR